VKQNYAIRPIKNLNYNESTQPYMKDLKILSVENLITFELCKFMYQVSHKIIPTEIVSIFGRPEHQYPTRFNQEPQFSQQRNFDDLSKSFLCKAPNQYSMLSTDLKDSSNIKIFSNRLKKSLL